MIKIIVLLSIFMAGCSANRVHVQPKVINDQEVKYVRGSPIMYSQLTLKPELAILDYSLDEMVIALSIKNTALEAMEFSEKNITVKKVDSVQMQQATVYSFEQLVNERGGNVSDNTAVLVGETAAGIGAGFVPFGGIAYSVGKLVYRLGSQNTNGHEERINKLINSQLSQNYLRLQTVNPGRKYAGILKIGFEDELEAGDTIVFQFSAGNEVEQFNFICVQPLAETGAD